jgi:hypothetical protein
MGNVISKLIEAYAEVNEKKKLDPVGQADADIDNDGDVDKSDKYLHNRRKAVKKAMKDDEMNELSNKTLTRYAMSADNDVQKRRSNRPAGKGDESDPKIGKRLDKINLAHKKGAFKEEVNEAYESVCKEMKKMHDEGYGKKAIMAKYKHMEMATVEKLYAQTCGTREEVEESSKAALAKKLAKAAAPSEKGKKAVTLKKAPFDIPKEEKNEEEIIMNPKKDKDKKADAETMNTESVDLDEDLTHQTVKPPSHTKKYSNSDSRDTNSIGGGGTKRHTVTSSQADAHDKTASHHDNVADAHTKASEKSSSFKIRSLHSKAARLHRNAAEAHRDSSHSSSGADNDGSIQKTAKHMHTAYHATMAANDSSKQARNMGTKAKRMNTEEVELEESLKKHMSPYDAKEFLKKHSAHNKDFHALPASSASAMHDKAKELKYKKSKSAPGSTGRMFHAALQRHADSYKGTSESVLPPVYARILEEREKHYKGATKPEGMMDNSKSSKGAMDMVNQPKEINNDDEKGHEDASKAGRVGPSAKARPADNMKGDKKVIPSATPMKGK